MCNVRYNKQANQRLKAEAGVRLMVKPEDVKKMVKSEVKKAKLSEISEVKDELKSDINDVRLEIRKVKDELGAMIHRNFMWTVGIVFVAILTTRFM